ncbi:5857_t:CDS:2 [Rhizophagus irregularis]|nr:5857_t:CDS:2 [Rhizophagus irregularis]
MTSKIGLIITKFNSDTPIKTNNSDTRTRIFPFSKFLKMTLPYLIDDCVYNILQYLQNDGSTLFNCLLVNRFWCKTTIPILYANPFATGYRKKHKLISTIILLFNKEEILQLKNQLGTNQIKKFNIDDEHKPLFEYLKYLEDYNYYKISSFMTRFIFCNITLSISSSLKECKFNISPIFHQRILCQSRNIKQLDISLDLFNSEAFKNFNVQNFISNLTKLKSLTLSLSLGDTNNNEIEQEFLGSIANNNFNNLNLRKLIIDLTSKKLVGQKINTCEKIYKIIQGQNKLKIFQIRNCCYSLLNNILLSLEFRKHSLVHIEILKELSFIRNEWNADVTSLMIKYLGESLQKLLIEDPTIQLIENISMYCPNLIFLEIRIYLYVDLSVLSFLKNLRIRILNIKISYNIDKIFFINLANNIPINISKISFSIYFCDFRLSKLKEFLENCHNSFEIINLNHIIEYQLLEIVLNYIERSNNSLKLLGMMKLNEKLNDKELKLLNQIEAKGCE